MTNPQINLTAQDVQQAANAGLHLLSRDTTLVPGSIRRQVGVLEGILAAVLNGRLVLVSPDQLAVESEPVEPVDPPEDPNVGDIEETAERRAVD